VKAKTRSGIDPAKPGRPEGSTRDPVDPVKPGWDPVYFFLAWLMLNDVVLAFVLEAKTTKNNEAELGILITDYRAISKRRRTMKPNYQFQIFNRWAEEQRRAEDRRRLDHCCFTAQKVSFLFLFTNLLLSLSLFFILGRVELAVLDFWASFCCWFSHLNLLWSISNKHFAVELAVLSIFVDPVSLIQLQPDCLFRSVFQVSTAISFILFVSVRLLDLGLLKHK
jgi:hypothetical protein